MNPTLPGAAQYALKLPAGLWRELSILYATAYPAEKTSVAVTKPSFSRATWLTLAYMALGKAELLEAGYFHDPQQKGQKKRAAGDARQARALRQLATVITHHFRPGDGQL